MRLETLIELGAQDFCDFVPLRSGKSRADLAVFAPDPVVHRFSNSVRVPRKMFADIELAGQQLREAADLRIFSTSGVFSSRTALSIPPL
jgi:hypothetical protein